MARKRTTPGSSGFTILVVDDREEALSSTTALLERDGHLVLTASSGEEALTFFQPGQIQLLIVDYIMPMMSGEELIQAIRKLDPDVQILLQTGYAGEKPPREMLQTLDIQCYHDKPDGPDSLLLWVDVALKASVRLQEVRETEQLKMQLLVKEEALANLCHEMRTPLQILSGYSEMLRDHIDPTIAAGPCREVESIQQQTQTLEFLISDFLYFAQLEEGVQVVVPQALDLSALQAGVEDLVEFLFQDINVLSWQLDPRLPLVWADQHSLLVVLRNVLAETTRGATLTQVEIAATLTEQGDRIELQLTMTAQEQSILVAPLEEDQDSHNGPTEARAQMGSAFPALFEGAQVGVRFTQRLVELMDGELSTEQLCTGQTLHTLSLLTATSPARLGREMLPVAA